MKGARAVLGRAEIARAHERLADKALYQRDRKP